MCKRKYLFFVLIILFLNMFSFSLFSMDLTVESLRAVTSTLQVSTLPISKKENNSDLPLRSATVIKDIKDDPNFHPPQRPTSKEEFLEKQAEILSLQKSYFSLTQDSLEFSRNHKHMFSALKLALKTRKGVLKTNQKDDLKMLEEIYGVSGIDSTLIQIQHINEILEQGLDNALAATQNYEKLLKDRPLTDEEWIKFFKYLLGIRIASQFKVAAIDHKMTTVKSTLPSTRPEDWESLDPSDRLRVSITKRSHELLEKQIFIAYQCLPLESLKDLQVFLKIPSLYLYLQGYQLHSNHAERKGFVKCVDDHGMPLYMETGLDLHTQNDLDLSYLLGQENILEGIPNHRELFENESLPVKETAIIENKNKKKKGAKKKSQKYEIPIERKVISSSSVSFSFTENVGTEAEKPLEATKTSSSIPTPPATGIMKANKEQEEKEEVRKDESNPTSAKNRYAPERPSISKRESRIAAIKESSALEKLSLENYSYKMVPQNPIVLTGEAAEIYSEFYKDSKQTSSVFTLSKIITLMKGFRGEGTLTEEEKKKMKIGKGNGSPYNLVLPVFVEKMTDKGLQTISIVSRRIIHEPHPHDSFGLQSLKLLRTYFSDWSLTPEQGYVRWR